TLSPAFNITTTPVTTATQVTISAVYAGVTSTAVLTVTPPAVSNIGLQSAHVAGGLNASATVTLTGPAPAGGAVVLLSSSNSAVPAGRRPARFAAGPTVSPPSSAPPTPGTPTPPFPITPSSGGAPHPATLTVDPTQVASMTLASTTVSSGRSLASNTVTLNGP